MFDFIVHMIVYLFVVLGANMLQAKMATRKAKPNGQFWLEPGDVESFMKDLSVTDLPGLWPTLPSFLDFSFNKKISMER